MLPEDLLQEVQEELLDWNSQDMSILELGHRSEPFKELMTSAEKDLRALVDIPSDYHILFLGGAARTQFSMIPLNFLSPEDKAGYLVTGIWSSLAYQEASLLKKAYVAASEEKNGYLKTPILSHSQLQEDTSYLYYTANETINGVQFQHIPQAGNLPLFSDMTSCLLTEPLDVKKFHLIFAGAQKNIANAGLTLVILKDELLSLNPKTALPTMLDYRVHVKHHSLYATPPVFNCYLAAKMFSWIKKQGGVESLYKKNCQKAEKLYGYIDASDFYQCRIEKQSRSLVNVCFTLQRPELTDLFTKRALQEKLYGLKGHRAVGGLRASLYNAMPLAGVEKLIQFMQEFSKECGR